MAFRGLFDSQASVPGDRKVGGLSKAMVMLSSVNSSALLTITGANKTRNYKRTSYEWTEKQHHNGLGFIVSNHGDPQGCMLQFNDTSWIVENMILFVPATGEFLFVGAVSELSVTVTRGYGTGQITDIIPNDMSDVMVIRVGTAFEEGSCRPTAISMLPGVPKITYTQIFRTTWALTGTAATVEYNHGDITRRMKRDTLMMHAKDIEMAFLLGVKSNGMLNGRPHRSFDGLYRQLRTNIAMPCDGILTKAQFDMFLEVIFSYTIEGRPNERIALCGRHALTLITRLVEMNSHYILEKGDRSYGFDIRTWTTPHGDITLVPHDLLTSLPGHHSDIILLHPDSLHALFMREAEEEKDILQESCGLDAKIGGLLSELTFAVEGELTGGIFTGICDVAADPTPIQITTPHIPGVHPGC